MKLVLLFSIWLPFFAMAQIDGGPIVISGFDPQEVYCNASENQLLLEVYQYSHNKKWITQFHSYRIDSLSVIPLDTIRTNLVGASLTDSLLHFNWMGFNEYKSEPVIVKKKEKSKNDDSESTVLYTYYFDERKITLKVIHSPFGYHDNLLTIQEISICL